MHHKNGALVILLAAGSSRRYSNHKGNNKHDHELPNSQELKQLELLNGKSVISYSLETFCSCHLVDEVIVMIPPGMQARFQDVINDLADNISGKISSKLRCIKEGGKNRFDSTHLAIAELADESGERSVLIHDAARPLVSIELVEKCIVALQTHPAVAAALPVTDTLGQLTYLDRDIGGDTGKDTSRDTNPTNSPLQTEHNQEYKISKIATRSDYCLLQTPQGFHLQLLRDSFQSAANEGGDTSCWTDDCSVVLAHNPDLSIHKIEGDACNIKLTHKEDKQILKSILHKQHDRSGS